MMPGILLKSIVSKLLLSAGIVDRKLGRLSRNGFCILMYHRILPPGMGLNMLQPGMYVTTPTFNCHIRYLKENFFPVSLQEIVNEHKGGRADSRLKCCLTFDDGWHDFFLHAFPVLKFHKVPATVFLPTDYIGRERWFWADRIGYLLHHSLVAQKKADCPSYHPATRQILSLSGSVKVRLEAAVSLLKASREDTIERVLSELESHLEVGKGLSGRAFVNWDEVRVMADSGFVHFGSHTASHRIMTTLDDEEVRRELHGSKKLLLDKGVASDGFIPFCYPNGNYNKAIKKLVAEVGYSIAVSTDPGWNDIRKPDIHCLKRISVHEDISSNYAMLSCRLAQIF